MRDIYVSFGTRDVTVSEMATYEVHAALDELARSDNELEFADGVTREDVVERLRIELMIRELGL